MKLTRENFQNGFLLDEELLGGITENHGDPNTYTAFVIHHTTGEYLGHQICKELDEALELINLIPREWNFEKTKGCDGGKCAEGKCKGEGCRVFDKNAASKRQADLRHCTEASGT